MRTKITLCSGREFDLANPNRNIITIYDIAHALSNLCRFNGHTTTFYSVAQHSVLVSQLVPSEHAMAGLLHDAHEAYIGDVTRPLKTLIPAFHELEKQVAAAVLNHFGIDSLPSSVVEADNLALVAELYDLLPASSPDRRSPSLPPPIIAWAPAQAKQIFLDRFFELHHSTRTETYAARHKDGRRY